MSMLQKQAKAFNNKNYNELLRIKRQMQGLKNEMDFIEILTNFWPLPNMSTKMERLEKRMLALNSRYEQTLEQLVS